MITIPDPQNMPELSSPSLPQAIRFFTPKQKSVLAFSGVVFLAVLAVSGAVFYFWLTSFKKSLVDFSIAGPNQIASGENGTYIISYWNNTNQILKNSALNIRYPQGAIIDGGKNTNIDLGSIGIGGGGKQEITIAFIGADKSIQKLEAALSYQPQNTSSTFENETAKEVAINGSALSVEFQAPEKILPNAKNIYTIGYKNNTDKVFQNVAIEANFPSNFTLVSSDRTPTKNNSWILGDLNPNVEGKIVISGILKSAQGDNFDVAIGIVENDKFYKFWQNALPVSLSDSPLKLNISVNDQANATANPGDRLQFKINYENNSGVALENVVLKAVLGGLMYDFATLKTGGYFNGVNNTITWNAGNMADLGNLRSGASGVVEFQINVKPQYVMRTFRDKNFLLQVTAEIETPAASAAEDIAVKINTKTELKTKGYYFDSAMKNSGPLPPKVNQATTYTIHWQVTNFSNDADNVMVRSTLPEGVAWLDKKSGAGFFTLEYNDRTGELIWNVGKVSAGTGVLLDPYEVIFQVSLTPAAHQANLTAPILGESALTGADMFTGTDIAATAPILKTDLPDDSGVGILKSRVQP